MIFSLLINNREYQVDVEPNTPLLWVLRDYLKLTGTKFGCGQAACGACTVLVDKLAIRSCVYPVQIALDKEITTIEGLGTEDDMHPVQKAWMDEVVPQCGYCQPGFMMATAALLEKSPEATDEDIDREILNICRCGTYYRMRKAIHRAANILREENQKEAN